jgi:Cu/Ag efflux pump CusA
MMLTGGNSRTVAQAVAERLAQIQKTLLEGVLAQAIYGLTRQSWKARWNAFAL